MNGNVLTRVLDWLRAGYPEGVPPKDYTPLLALLGRTLTPDELGEVVAALARQETDPVRVSQIRAAIADVTSAAPGEDEVRRVAVLLADRGVPLSTKAQRIIAAREDLAAAADEPRSADPTDTPDAGRRGERQGALGAEAGPHGAEAEPHGAEAGPHGAEAGPHGAEAGSDRTEAGSGGADATEPGPIAQALRWLGAGYPDGIPAQDRVPILALLRRRLTDDEVQRVCEAVAAQSGADPEVSLVDAQVLMMKVLGELPGEEDVERVRARLEQSGFTLS